MTNFLSKGLHSVVTNAELLDDRIAAMIADKIQKTSARTVWNIKGLGLAIFGEIIRFGSVFLGAGPSLASLAADGTSLVFDSKFLLWFDGAHRSQPTWVSILNLLNYSYLSIALVSLPIAHTLESTKALTPLDPYVTVPVRKYAEVGLPLLFLSLAGNYQLIKNFVIPHPPKDWRLTVTGGFVLVGSLLAMHAKADTKLWQQLTLDSRVYSQSKQAGHAIVSTLKNSGSEQQQS